MSRDECASFHFAICQVHCQDLLKREVLLRYPGFRLAYSRPGLVTFKGPLNGALFSPWLALEAGISLGKAPSEGELGLASELASDSELGRVSAVRVWRPEPEDGALRVDLNPAASAPWLEWVQGLRGAGSSRDGGPLADDPEGIVKYLEVVLPGGGQSAAPIWLGMTPQRTSRLSPARPVVPPEGAPSRAYSKVVEAIEYFKLPVGRGQVVLELGAAPGGASLALLERGQHVVAVDPGQMSDQLGLFAVEKGLHFRHVQKKGSALDRNDLAELPGPVEWIVSDINLAPPVAVTQLAHAFSLVKKSARAFVVTFKINDEHALKSVPGALEQLAKLAGRPPEIRHLPSHRREFAVVVGA